MSPAPPSNASQASSHGNQSPDAQFRVVRKRNRVPLSCGPCRHRKLKCNRAHPCDNCLKRGDSASCTYASPQNRKRNGTSVGSSGTPDEMQNRIDRLENLVLSLMNTGSQPVDPNTAAAAISRINSSASAGEASRSAEDDDMRESTRDEDSEVEQVSRSIGVMKVHQDRQFFAPETHWWAILSDIAEVKRYFAEHQKQYEEQIRKVAATKTGGAAAGTSLLFKGTEKVERNKIVANFPSRLVADKLITRYFNTENPSIRILHRPTFSKEYERHWATPDQSSVTWIGMCFAMMSMAFTSYAKANDEPPEYRGKCREMALTFSEWTTQCLVHADFTQPVNYMIEALCLHLQAEYARNKDVETGLWMLSGIIIRLAMRMGMHRDSKPYASLSAFQGEMRRRVWSIIRSTDIQLSFQCGLPNMIKSTETDTQLPANLYDEEFNEQSETLPASRPISEPTPMSFMIAHIRLTTMLGKVQEHANALIPVSYEVTMKLDAELREAYSQVPEHLRLGSPEDSMIDPANLLMQRYTLNLTYHKSQCALHRKFLSRARENTRYAYSCRTCIEACLAMLDHQSTLYTETQAGGRLRSITWSITTSLTTHDFLLAAMILCLDLYHTAQAEAANNTSSELYQWALERRETMFTAIERAIAIWETLKDTSMEAYKASSILKVMLEKLRTHQILRQQMSSTFNFTPSSNGAAADSSVAPEHSAAMTLGMLRGGGVTPDTVKMMNQGYMGPPRTGLTPQPNGEQQAATAQMTQDSNSPFQSLFGASFGGFQGMDLPGSGFGWDEWDTYVQGALPDANNVFDSGYVDASGQLVAPDMDLKQQSQQQQQQQQPGQFRMPPQANSPWFFNAQNPGKYAGASPSESTQS